MLNTVVLIGRLGRDPELRRAGESAVCSFSLATDRYTGGRGGKAEKKTDWVNCVAWRDTAERLCEMACKGTLLLVQGRVSSSEYKNRAGETQKKTEVTVSTLRILGDGSKKAPGKPQREPGDDYGEPEITDEDVPF